MCSPSTTSLLVVHLDSLSKPASAGYDRPAERRPAAAFDSIRRCRSLLQSRGSDRHDALASAENRQARRLCKPGWTRGRLESGPGRVGFGKHYV
jgi:hypothetical protein